MPRCGWLFLRVGWLALAVAWADVEARGVIARVFARWLVAVPSFVVVFTHTQMSIVTPAEAVAENQSRYNNVVLEDSMSGYLKMVRDMLLYRLPVHAQTNNSVTSAKIQNFNLAIDQLLVHIEQADMLSFMSKLNDVLSGGLKIRECIVKQRVEDEAAVKRYRNMVYQLWSRFTNKVKAIVLAIVEQNKGKNPVAVLQSLMGKLDEQLADASLDLAEMTIPESAASMFN